MNLINLKAAFRSLGKSKLQSIICVTGMGIGMGSIILIGILAIHQYSFDKYIPDYKKVFRVVYGDDVRTAYPLLEKAKEEIPALENGFRFMQAWEIEFRDKNNDITIEEAFSFADPEIFECLGLSFKQGRAAKTKNEIAISEEMAKNHFGDTFPIGETMEFSINNVFRLLTISGVYKNIPSNSSLEANYIAYIDLLEDYWGDNSQLLGRFSGTETDYLGWDNMEFASYLLLNDPASATNVESILNGYTQYQSNQPETVSNYSLQPVKDIYLRSGNMSGNTYARSGNPNDLYYYLAISLLIFIISLINFIVLTRARTEIRAGEMGTKKAMGAQPGQIRSQIVTESFLLIALSIIPAIFLMIIGMPFINRILEQNIDLSVFNRPETWATLLVVFASTGLISGFFIGHRISMVPILLLLKGGTVIKRKNMVCGNSVLTVHFAIFILLTTCVIGLQKQINFALNNFSAIDPENILIYELSTPELSSKFDVFKTEIEKIPGTVKVAGSSFIPPFNYFLPIHLADTMGSRIPFDGLIMGDGMVELLGMEFIWGEDFGDFQPNRNNVIFNESAAKEHNLDVGDNFLAFNVKGVVKDFSAHSLHSLIQPMVILQQAPERYSLLAIKTEGENDQAIISSMNNMLKEYGPDQYIDSYYLTDQINRFYRNEQRQSVLIKAFALLAIILSIMGLFGIVVNTASRKTKEIGIRKVNGAKISEIMLMLNIGFIKWIALSFIVATPIAWYIMKRWLENFAYKTELSWWIFALAGLLALGIALLTVSWQSWKAATRNPVEALRYE